MQRYRVGILGCTGIVGQRLLQRLEEHPWFDAVGLGASERSAGRPYGDVVRWHLSDAPPAAVRDVRVRRCRVEAFEDCELVLSALDRDVAEEIEPAFRRAGFAVVSNSSVFRMADDVPLLIPEVNPDHVEMVDAQRRESGGGFIVTNPNCSTTGLALALAPLERAFGVRRVIVATLQAISGAGAEGPRSLEMLDNVLPWIRGEEEKIETEMAKIFGTLDGSLVRPAGLEVSAHCHRVSTLDGHLEALSVELAEQVSPERVVDELRRWRGAVAELALPTSPPAPLLVRDEADRPQPRLDRDAGGGMSVVVGRVRPCRVLGLRMVVLSHNAVRGAAGGTLLNAELLAASGKLPGGTRAWS